MTQPAFSTALDTLERVPEECIPEALGALERAKAVLWARLCAPRPSETTEDARRPIPPPLLSTGQVSVRLGMSRRWVYRNRKKLGGKKLGANVRFTESGLKRYLGGLP